jgi:hypothetical protein
MKFWVWVLASISAIESTCGMHGMKVGVTGNAPGKTAIGLLQMNKEYKDRYWRSKSCAVSEREIISNRGNLRCGIDIMEWLVTGSKSRNPLPIYTNQGIVVRTAKDKFAQSYWEKLNRPRGGPIGDLIRAYRPCQKRNYVELPMRTRDLPPLLDDPAMPVLRPFYLPPHLEAPIEDESDRQPFPRVRSL